MPCWFCQGIFGCILSILKVIFSKSDRSIQSVQLGTIDLIQLIQKIRKPIEPDKNLLIGAIQTNIALVDIVFYNIFTVICHYSKN